MAAGSTVDLGSTGVGFFAGIEKAMQDIVNFVGGPGVVLIVFVSAAAALGLWVMAPKQGSAAVGWLLRIIVAGIVLLNLAVIITYFQGLA